MVFENGYELDGQATDISFSGICVHTGEAVESRTRVNFHIWVALPERDTDELILPGRIVWSTPVEGMQQLGGAFDRDMDSYAWTRLDVLLQFLSGIVAPERL